VVVRRIPGAEDGFGSSSEAACRVMAVAKEFVTLQSVDRILYHADALRATTVLLQILARKPDMDRHELEKLVASCRDGIAICRALIPKVLCRIEDKFEALVNQ